MTADLAYPISLSGVLLILGMLLVAVVIALGFGIALCRGVLVERRRARTAADEPPRT